MDKVMFIICFESVYFLLSFYFQNKNVKKNSRFSFITYLGNLICSNFMLLSTLNSGFVSVFQYSICVAIYVFEYVIYFWYFEIVSYKKYTDNTLSSDKKQDTEN